jgi:PEGA domain-containing protein
MPGADPDPEVIERSRSPVLPSALMLVLGLLAGFAAGAYYMSSPAHVPPPAVGAAPAATAGTQGSASPAGPAGPAGPATADRPGQYSEQKVTSPTAGGVPPTEGARPPLPGAAEADRRARAGGAATPSTARGSTTSTAARGPVRGRLVVQSTPSRAAVTIDGKWRGRTPLTLDDLPFGTYVVRVVQPGYRIAREEVRLNAANASHTFAARLEAEPRPAPAVPAPAPPPQRTVPPPTAAAGNTTDSYTGSIYVDSRPRGATVLIDGRNVGQTPLSLPGVPIGSHVVKIEMTGKQPWSATTRVTAGAMARVTGSLEDK